MSMNPNLFYLTNWNVFVKLLTILIQFDVG